MDIWPNTCFIIDTLERHGAQKQLLLIARYLQRNKRPAFNLIVFREPLTLLADFEAAGVNVLLVKKQKEIDIIFIFNLIRAIKKIKPIIVVTFLISPDIWGRLAALLTRVPIIGSSVREMPRDFGFFKDKMLLSMDTYSDFIVCNSKKAFQITLNRSRIQPKKVSVIYNGIELDTDERHSPDVGEITIGLVARLVPLKDVSTLLRAFVRIFSEFATRVIIVGDGPSRPDLEAEAERLCITDSVLFMGERSDVPEIIQQFHIGLLTSRYEGLSNVIMEYMRAGIPVVATNVGGNPELVEDGVTGYLFEPGNEVQLADILHKLIVSPNKRAQMGHSGRNKMIADFSVESMVSAWNDTLNSAIS